MSDSENLIIPEKKIVILDKIHQLYIKVIERFKQGQMEFFDPNILKKLTEEMFYQWVIVNNQALFDFD